MDTSETYIKQCDCPEIQKKWKPKDWKSYTVWHTRLKTVGDIIYGRDWEHSEGELIYLPRQDQIQEMIREFYSKKVGDKRSHNKWFPEGYVGLGYVLKGFTKFASNFWLERYNSFEQLWLAFYMWEKHKKVWNGEKWVK